MRKNIIYGLLAFIIPISVYIFVFYLHSLFSGNIFRYDFLQQYYPLYHYLKDFLNGNNTLFYDYSFNLGGTHFGTFFYYLSSPFNILIYFINKNNIINFMNALIIIKLGLSGLTMYLYLNRKFKNNNVLTLLFSMCYSLMGYNVSYIINIMWFDVVMLSPLVLMGLDNILNDKKPTLYMITLFLSILSNYYIGYNLCIFIVVYYLYELLVRYDLKKDQKLIKKKIIQLIIPSLLAGLMCSFFLIPCYLEAGNYGRDIDGLKYLSINFDYLSMFPKMFLGTSGDELTSSSTYSPNIYCGLIILPLVYLYLVNKNIPKKERRLTLLVLIILFAPCIFKGLNYIFHLFTKPIGFNYRFSFLLCLFMIVISYKSILNLAISFKKILIYVVILILIALDVIICKYFNIVDHYTYVNYYLLVISILLTFIYFILLFKRKKIIIIFVMIELIGNTLYCMNTIDYYDGSNINNYSSIGNTLYSDFRTYNSNTLTYHDNFIYHYDDISSNLSTINGYKKTLFINTNLDRFYNHFSIMDDLLSVKYICVDPEKNINDYIYLDSVIINDHSSGLYYNPDALSIGYIIKNKCNNIKKDMYYLYDQQLLNCLIDEENEYYKPYNLKNKGNYYYIDKEERTGKYIILYIDYREKDSKDYVKTNIEKYKTILSSMNNNYQFQIVDKDILDDKIKITYGEYIKNIKAWYYDKDLVDEKIKILAKEQLKYKKHKDYIEGSITTDGGILMITIPYEKGFNIYVDGKKVPYYEVMDTFIGVDLTKGNHHIIIKYKQPGLLLGIIISVISFMLSIIYLIICYKKEK